MEQDELIAKINRLYEHRQKLLATGNIAPDGAWIHTYSIYREFKSGFVGEYIYGKWQAHEAIFRRSQRPKRKPPIKTGKDPEFTNHQYIGRVGSNTGLGMEPEVEVAYQAEANRRRLTRIDRATREINQILDLALPDVMPEETANDITP